MFVKICGITDEIALAAAVAGGADAVGFVFAPSPRQVTPERASALCRGLPGHIVRVAVMREPHAAEWMAVMASFAPDWVQCELTDLERHALPPGVTALPVYRTGQARPVPLPPRILVEGPMSGSGQRTDWSVAAALAHDAEVVLAGGLRADNVAEAIAAVRPWGVDVSSGVELRRGRKDPALIREFIQTVRELERAIDSAH